MADIIGYREQILANCKILYPDKKLILATTWTMVRHHHGWTAYLIEEGSASVFQEKSLAVPPLQGGTTVTLASLLNRTEQLLATEHQESLQISQMIDEAIVDNYEELTYDIDDEDVKAEVHAQLQKREEARVLKERADRKKEIQDKAKALVRMLGGEDNGAQTIRTVADEDRAESAMPADAETRVDSEHEELAPTSEMELESFASSMQHPPSDGSAPGQPQLTTPDEMVVSAAVGPYAAKLLRGIEVIEKLRAENAECNAERSMLRTKIESLELQATQREQDGEAQREHENETERERELECESWARAVSQLQTRNDRLVEALARANTRTLIAQAWKDKFEAALKSWQRYFEIRSLRIDISGSERAQCASAADSIQDVLSPEFDTAAPSSASSDTEGAHTPSTETTVSPW
ncbi:hypothetical protein BZA05DRAFT_263671 [Tricharina praecox]|uniref:uncharacterized protein n=1 Tax=Tricharina praecox TaxID=43433 RepID=UPI00221E8C82|nr:uncharacterized protein BZA05DRAFT_263671 [Tricharina praecox]KAI5854358.1 hypothetical protein BZA05DRAFT_263671 [Tricharina praecox]